jgi:ADP-ribosylglycohydrolase
LAWDTERAMAALRRVGVPASQHDFEQGLPAQVTPVLLTALYAALKLPTDMRGALALVLRGGGEVDVASGVVGAVLGASLGTEAIPARLRKHVLYAEALVETADRLFDAKLERVPVTSPAWATVKR